MGSRKIIKLSKSRNNNMSRTYLKEIKTEDWHILAKIRNEPDARKASINSRHFSKIGYQNYIRNQLNQNKRNRHWAVILNNIIIGHVKIINQELGYIITKKYRNKGLGTQVLVLLLKEAKKLGYKKVFDVVKIDQPISLWFAIKNGFEMIGIMVNANSKPYAYRLSRKL